LNWKSGLIYFTWKVDYLLWLLLPWSPPVTINVKEKVKTKLSQQSFPDFANTGKQKAASLFT